MKPDQHSREELYPPTDPASRESSNESFLGRRFLVLERLKPGDVILSLEREKKSHVTKLSAGGRFAHAAIVLDKFRYLESTFDDDYAGVRVTFFLPELFARLDSGEHTALKDVTACLRYELFRYMPPQENTAQFASFQRNIDALAFNYIAKPYATRAQLIRSCLAYWAPSRLRTILTKTFCVKAISSALWWLPKPAREGYFCSMLVAALFADGGINLFTTPLVMPKHLADPLQPITDSVVISGETLAGARVSPSKDLPVNPNEILPMTFRAAQKQGDLVALITEVNKTAAEKIAMIAKRTMDDPEEPKKKL